MNNRRIRRVVLLQVLSCVGLSLLAATAYGNDAPQVPAVGLSQVANVVLALAVIVGIILVLAFVGKKLNRLQTAGGKHLRIIEAISLGTKDRLLLVQVDQHRLLLSHSLKGIEALHVFLPGGHGVDPTFATALARAETPGSAEPGV